MKRCTYCPGWPIVKQGDGGNAGFQRKLEALDLVIINGPDSPSAGLILLTLVENWRHRARTVGIN